MPEAESDELCTNRKICEQTFRQISSELAKLSSKFDAFHAKMFESNGLSIVTRVAVLETSVESIEETIKDDKKNRSKYTDMIASTLIQVAVTALIGAAVLMALWEKGALGK